MLLNRSTLCLVVVFTLAASLMALAAPAPAPAPSPAPGPAARPPIKDEDIAAARAANGDFAIDLYRQLAKTNDGKNVFLSPLSISTALSIASEGATGETAAEMGKALRFPDAARNAGLNGASSTRPWKTETIHKGQAAITARLMPPPVPEATRARIASLKKELETANAQLDKANRDGKFGDVQKLSATAERAAAELNKLYKTTDLYELRIGNALWAEKSYPFKPAYVDTLKKFYGGEKLLMPVDFRGNAEAVRKQINTHVEQQTADRIKDLVPQGAVDGGTKLVITNAVYFKGQWQKPFEESETKEQDFVLADGKPRKTPMMYQWNSESARYGAFNADGSAFATPREVPIESKDEDPKFYPAADGFTSVEIAYKGGEMTMVLLAPQSADGLGKLEELLTHDKLQAWIGKLDKRSVRVHVPKFKLETNYKLVEPLQTLGMKRAFVDPASPGGAQFDGMTAGNNPGDRLFISDVLHKTFVEVSEKGTEAAAATAVLFAPTSAAFPREPPKTRPFTPIFKADKPFLFLIRDNATKSLVFLGRIVNPAG